VCGIGRSQLAGEGMTEHGGRRSLLAQESSEHADRAQGCGGCGKKSAEVEPPVEVRREPCDSVPPEAKLALSELLSTGDLARGCETTLRTIRFYEEAKLIEPAARSEGGHRMFKREQLPKLQLIMDMREAGLSVQEIRDLFELKTQCATPEQASTKLVQALEDKIDCMHRKITALRRLREDLATTVEALRECSSCDEPQFHSKCGDCDVMERPDLPRAMKFLWGGEPE
jgi:MerR family transcriptional regulator, Zn(II)-responsive regulator of zntA